jgi:hypothetical protein
MQALVRAAGRRLSAGAGQVRRMSSGVSQEEEVKQMNLWRNVTIAGACRGDATHQSSLSSGFVAVWPYARAEGGDASGLDAGNGSSSVLRTCSAHTICLRGVQRHGCVGTAQYRRCVVQRALQTA